MNCLALLLLLILLTLASWASQATSHALPETSMYDRHEQWMAQYGRAYEDGDEKDKRFMIFRDNVARIESFNKDMGKSYKLGINQFADLTNEEFTASRNRFKAHVCSSGPTSFKYHNVTAVPSTVDWRKKGAVTPIKDQGQCGKMNHFCFFSSWYGLEFEKLMLGSPLPFFLFFLKKI